MYYPFRLWYIYPKVAVWVGVDLGNISSKYVRVDNILKC